jgi:hypothetical protein
VTEPYDPFKVLWLPHDPELNGWQLLRGYLHRRRVVSRWIRDRSWWPGEARAVRRAVLALATRARRRAVLADLAVQHGLLGGLGYHPGRQALADALLTPLINDECSFDEALDRRALERQAAVVRLERRAQGKKPWPAVQRRPSGSNRDRLHSDR